jgi:hypothetical protein
VSRSPEGAECTPSVELYAYTKNRKIATSLTLVAMGSLAVIAFYQVGLLKRLPEPAVAGLDAEKVNGSAEAYEILGVPDALLGLGSYSVTLGLAALGESNRAKAHPWIPLALLLKCAIDTIEAATLTRKSWVKFKVFSLYSLIAATATFLTFPFVFPEARAAWRVVADKN